MKSVNDQLKRLSTCICADSATIIGGALPCDICVTSPLDVSSISTYCANTILYC